MPSNVRNRELSVARQASINDIVTAYVSQRPRPRIPL